jgi:hypothetical protein
MKRLAIIAVLALVSTSAWSGILNVPDPYPTIQSAVDDAGAGDTVLVAPGTYADVTHEAGDGDTTMCAVIMKSDITLLGSGAGLTIIDADSAGRGIHCRGVSGSTISDFTITGCFAEDYGAAIFCTVGSSPTIMNCDIVKNYDGGIICLYTSSPTIEHCVVDSNFAKQGGGIAIEDECHPEVRNCEVRYNASPSGGGIFIRKDSQPIIEDCFVDENVINSDSGSGGGIGIVNAQPTIRRVTMIDNDSGGGGGGLFIADGSEVTVTDCVIQGNSTSADYGPGGGIRVDFSSLVLERVLIARNSIVGIVSEGGGIFASTSNLEMYQCTVATNTIDDEFALAGGIYLFESSPIIDKSIVAFNEGAGLYCSDGLSVPVVSCTDIYGNPGGDGICGTDAGGNFSLDPLFCDMNNDDYRIHPDSPCAAGNHPEGPLACDGDRLGSENSGCASDVGDIVTQVGGGLLFNYPNPFGSTTDIRFQLTDPGRAMLRIIDPSGRVVRGFDLGTVGMGIHHVTWDGRNGSGEVLPSGVYFYQLNFPGETRTGRMVITR